MRKLNCIILFILILTMPTMLSGCDVSPHQDIEKANIDVTFEEDYAQLEQVANYLLELEHNNITIRSVDYISADFGEKIKIIDGNVRETLNDLFNKGYLIISKNNSTVNFARWEKTLSPEFSAGFAFKQNAEDDLNIQYVIETRELPKGNWYYYEEDYNEWRANNQ